MTRMKDRRWATSWRWTPALVAGLAVGMATTTALAQKVTFTKLWDIPADSQPHVTSVATERGIAINPVTGNVLIVSRNATYGLGIYVLDGNTGELLNTMDMTDVTGGTFALSTVGVAADGVIYAANLVPPSADTRLFRIYRWADEGSAPTVAYEGNPSDGQRFGDSLDVRGVGVNTQIAVGAGNAITGVRFAVFTTQDGETFTANTFSPENVAADYMKNGITFGPGDTVFGKIGSQTAARYASFDPAAGSSSLIASVPGLGTVAAIDYYSTNNGILSMSLLAGMDYVAHSLRFYEVSDPATPVALESFPFPTPNVANGNGVGAVDFGRGKVVAVDTQNGVLAYAVEISLDAQPPTITAQPADTSSYSTGTARITVGALGTAPLHYQWYSGESTLIEGATNATLVLSNVQSSASGTYYAVVSNAVNTVTSSNVTLTVVPLVQSGRLTPLWSLPPGSRSYINTDNTQRGVAYNPVSGRVLLISRTAGATNIYVLDGSTGAELHRLRSTDANGDPFLVGGTFALNMIGVGDDGAVYAGNLTTSGAGFTIYRWADDGPDTIPTIAYGPADPGVARVGDTLDVRAAGVDTQILAGSRNGTTVAIFTTVDGLNFTATVVDVTGAVAGNFGLGVAFGAGNTVWGSSSGTPPPPFIHASFDLATGTGAVVDTFPREEFPFWPIAVHATSNLLAAVSIENPLQDNVRLYDLSVLPNPPVLLHQELFPTDNANANGTGSADFGNGRLYALNSNNGLVAYTITAGSVTPGPIAVALNGDKVTLTWTGPGTLQAASEVDGTFTDVAGAASPYEVQVNTATRQFYRLKN